MLWYIFIVIFIEYYSIWICLILGCILINIKQKYGPVRHDYMSNFHFMKAFILASQLQKLSVMIVKQSFLSFSPFLSGLVVTSIQLNLFVSIEWFLYSFVADY